MERTQNLFIRHFGRLPQNNKELAKFIFNLGGVIWQK